MADITPARQGYHGFSRPELLELIPRSAKMIFDLGCGMGLLGHSLKKRQACHVAGIELNKEAAALAAKNIDVVYTDNLNRFDPGLSKNRYDCLIFADILEHLITPWTVLSKFVSVLTDNGTVVASIPNVAHPFVIDQLQRGLFRYEQAGLLDITHLRFFTKSTIFQLFVKCGLKITGFRPWPSAADPVQYHITAVKPKPVYPSPVVTILILTYNGIKYTAQCISSIKKHTDIPYKIIVVDNGSSDETVEMLRKDIEIQHIENTHNLGFGRGFNLGLACVQTPYFVLANNDIVVTANWLSRLKKHLDTDDKLLLVGPRSNFVSGPQLMSPVPYSDQAGLDEYARLLNWGNVPPLTYYPRIVFFCVLLKSLALHKIGLFDEIFGLGNFEDDDYCMRIHRAGYKAAFDNSVFVHHYGSRSFIDNKIDYAKLMAENKATFAKKWGIKEA